MRQVITKKVKNTKIAISILILILIAICVFLQYTPLSQYYWIKVIAERVVQNTGNLFYIAIILIILNIVEKKKFKKDNVTILQKGEQQK